MKSKKKILKESAQWNIIYKKGDDKSKLKNFTDVLSDVLHGQSSLANNACMVLAYDHWGKQKFELYDTFQEAVERCLTPDDDKTVLAWTPHTYTKRITRNTSWNGEDYDEDYVDAQTEGLEVNYASIAKNGCFEIDIHDSDARTRDIPALKTSGWSSRYRFALLTDEGAKVFKDALKKSKIRDSAILSKLGDFMMKHQDRFSQNNVDNKAPLSKTELKADHLATKYDKYEEVELSIVGAAVKHIFKKNMIIPIFSSNNLNEDSGYGYMPYNDLKDKKKGNVYIQDAFRKVLALSKDSNSKGSSDLYLRRKGSERISQLKLNASNATPFKDNTKEAWKYQYLITALFLLNYGFEIDVKGRFSINDLLKPILQVSKSETITKEILDEVFSFNKGKNETFKEQIYSTMKNIKEYTGYKFYYDVTDYFDKVKSLLESSNFSIDDKREIAIDCMYTACDDDNMYDIVYEIFGILNIEPDGYDPDYPDKDVSFDPEYSYEVLETADDETVEAVYNELPTECMLDSMSIKLGHGGFYVDIEDGKDMSIQTATNIVKGMFNGVTFANNNKYTNKQLIHIVEWLNNL